MVKSVKQPAKLPDGWEWKKIGDVCDFVKETRDPRKSPDAKFIYIDISSVDSESKTIREPVIMLGRNAPSRARKVVRKDDIILSMTRPNLNAIALISDMYDNQICSTGFSVLRAKSNVSHDFVFQYMQGKAFIEHISSLVQGALYPAVTEKQIYDIALPLPLARDEQVRIARMLQAALGHSVRARNAARTQLAEIEALPRIILDKAFRGEI